MSPGVQPRWAGSYAPGVPLTLDYADETLVDLQEASVARHGARPAFDFLGAGTTYAVFGERILRVAAGLQRLGVGPGDRVAVLLPNCPQNLVAFYAVLRLGATVVEHNPLYTARELRGPFADHGAKVAIVWDSAVPVADELARNGVLEHVVAVDLTEELPWTKRLALRLPLPKARAARAMLTTPAPGAIPWRELVSAAPLDDAAPRPTSADVALLLYTSGTTGTPKGVPLTHANLVANARQSRAWAPDLVEGEEVFLAVLPMFHAYGVTLCVTTAVTIGAEVVLLPKPEIGLLMDAITSRSPTFIPAVPPLYARILDEAQRRGVSLRGVRRSFSGAMPLPPELVERWEAATGGLLVEGYGLTETAPIIVGNPLSTQRRAGSIGVPLPDTQVRVADLEDLTVDVPLGEPGELLVRGPQVFSGYRNLPDATAEAFHEGWFRTGDVVTMSEDGFLTIADRIKELIITGGFNVYPSEVEEVLRQHAAVVDCAVVGVAGDDGSEQVCAAVVLEAGVDLDEDDLRRHCRAGLTAYKVPRRFVALEELPTNPIGKVVRKDAAKLVAEQLG